MKLWKNKIPDPNEFFKPLYNIYGGDFKVKNKNKQTKKLKENKTHTSHSAFCVVSKVAHQMLPVGGIFSTAGAPHCSPLLGPCNTGTFPSCSGASTAVTNAAGALLFFNCSTRCRQISVGNNSTCSTPVEITPQYIHLRPLMCHCFRLEKQKRPVRGRLLSEISDNFLIHIF